MKNKKVEIPVSGLFNREECLWFLNRGFDDCMYRVYENKVRRAFKLSAEIMLVDIYPMWNKLIIEWLNGHPSDQGITMVVKFVADWFDLDTDLSLFYKVIVTDIRISYMAKEYAGLRFIGMPDFFEALAWCIIGQQINLSFTYKVKRKLVDNGQLIML